MWKRVTRRIFIAVVAVLALLVLPGILSAQGNSEWAFERVKEVQEAHTKALMAKAGVVGTAIGDGQGAQPIILVLIEHGGVAGIPAKLDGVPARPLVTGKIFALPKKDKPSPPGKPGGGDDGDVPVDPTAKFDWPVPIGVSTGHPEVTAGTIGCRVTDGTYVYALSNNHVYADENLALIGGPVIQPGSYDGGASPADDIGTLSAFVPIVFSTSATNTIDAAIARCSTTALDNGTPSDGYGIPFSQIIPVNELTFRMKVKKYGRTTGLTTNGRVTGINATVDVSYATGVARFVDQIVISGRGFSAPGDSGSLIVSNSLNPVGLLFAGSGTTTIANPIEVVLGSLEVTIDGQ